MDAADPLGIPPPKEKIACPGAICKPTIMQNFTPIGATVAERSVTGEREQNSKNIPLLYWRMAGSECSGKKIRCSRASTNCLRHTNNSYAIRNSQSPVGLLLECWYGKDIEFMGCCGKPSLFTTPDDLLGCCPGYTGAEGGPG